MDLRSVAEGPALLVCFVALGFGVATRFAFFLLATGKRPAAAGIHRGSFPLVLGRLFLPFHKAALRKPGYAALRYLFHTCLFAAPLFASGHVALWEESRFELSLPALPDVWVDWMTLSTVGLIVFFFARRLAVAEVRRRSSKSDFALLTITALPFLTGYALSHGTPSPIAYLERHMDLFHVLSGEAMILAVVFLFCRARLDREKCVACVSCELACPTGTLTHSDVRPSRVIEYSHYQCICCGSCVVTCPEAAVELRHEISIPRFFQVFSKERVRDVTLLSCPRCGASFAPEPQVVKLRDHVAEDYLDVCPRCKKVRFADVFFQKNSTG